MPSATRHPTTVPTRRHAPCALFARPRKVTGSFPRRRFQKQIEDEEKKRVAADRKTLKSTSKKDKVERLEGLLNKSIAYSEFLADRIKKEGEGAIAVSDGSVKGPGLPQPKLIMGGEMRPYQLVRPASPLDSCTEPVCYHQVIQPSRVLAGGRALAGRPL